MAEVKDCVYIFRSCVMIVLSQYPVKLPHVIDVKELIEGANYVSPSSEFLRNFEKTPDPRQHYPDSSKPGILRQNAIEALRLLSIMARNMVKIDLTKLLQNQAKRQPLELSHTMEAAAAPLDLRITWVHALIRQTSAKN